MSDFAFKAEGSLLPLLPFIFVESVSRLSFRPLDVITPVPFPDRTVRISLVKQASSTTRHCDLFPAVLSKAMRQKILEISKFSKWRIF